VEREVQRLLKQFELSKRVERGERIGITAGSRGIRDKPRVLRILVEHLKNLGTIPLIIPCMGSHGGTTAKGQVDLLESLGITEDTVGAPILSSMEVKEIGWTKFGAPVLVDKNLCEMDKIVVVNRIKPHTDFKGEFESGLIKMIAIGMGKHQGALTAHRLTITWISRSSLGIGYDRPPKDAYPLRDRNR
jgi:nickel-dependent lactate racemase